jgi:photosystem II stability/assembly factor-like uncharacterized protein
MNRNCKKVKAIIICLCIVLLSSCTARITPVLTNAPPSVTPFPLPTKTVIPSVEIQPSLTPTDALKPTLPIIWTSTPFPINQGPIMPTRSIDLTFVDNLHGWLIGESYVANSRYLALASTIDGGKTWQALSMPSDMVYVWDAPIKIIFTNQYDGWFLNSNLYSTHDGGKTWQEVHPKGLIIGMNKAADGSVWALEEDTCKCKWSLWTAKTADYAGWQLITSNFPVEILKGVVIYLASPQYIWIFYWSIKGDRNFSNLLLSRDSGRHWEELQSPCNDYPTYQGNLVVVDKDHLWLGCGWPAGLGSGSKFVFSSSDGGKSWVIKGKGALPPNKDNTLSTIGYFGQIDALSSTFAYMKWYRTISIMITTDGGNSWVTSRLPCSIEFDRILFVDPLHGWAYDQTCINRTNDGGKTWECTELPDNKKCSVGP